MILIFILSVILIWLHISSLRFVKRAGSDESILEKGQELQKYIASSEEEYSLKSFSAIFSIGAIALLSLMELGYFFYCVYLFDDPVIIIGSSILGGYTIYSIIKFIPNIKIFYKKPLEYLKEKTRGFENILSVAMACLELLFCAYILVKIIVKYKFFS